MAAQSIDNLPYIGSMEKPLQGKKKSHVSIGPFSVLKKALRALCMGFHFQSISSRWSIQKYELLSFAPRPPA